MYEGIRVGFLKISFGNCDDENEQRLFDMSTLADELRKGLAPFNTGIEMHHYRSYFHHSRNFWHFNQGCQLKNQKSVSSVSCVLAGCISLQSISLQSIS